MDLYGSPYSSPHYSSYHDSSSSSSSRDRSRWLTVAAVTAVLGVSAYWFHTLVEQYGFQGAVSYIWEGDPYPDQRDRLDKLEAVKRKMAKPTKLLETLETALERAHLDTIDSADATSVVSSWQTNLRNTDLRTRLGILSSDLDKLAAQVDGVVSDGSTILKDAKKQLSQRLVQLMDRTDKLVTFYQQGRNEGGAGEMSSTTPQQ